MRSVFCPLLLLSVAACTAPKVNTIASAESPHALAFIEDDYAKAVTEAKSRSLPIFVDVWAPW